MYKAFKILICCICTCLEIALANLIESSASRYRTGTDIYGYLKKKIAYLNSALKRKVLPLVAVKLYTMCFIVLTL